MLPLLFTHLFWWNIFGTITGCRKTGFLGWCAVFSLWAPVSQKVTARLWLTQPVLCIRAAANPAPWNHGRFHCMKKYKSERAVWLGGDITWFTFHFWLECVLLIWCETLNCKFRAPQLYRSAFSRVSTNSTNRDRKLNITQSRIELLLNSQLDNHSVCTNYRRTTSNSFFTKKALYKKVETVADSTPISLHSTMQHVNSLNRYSVSHSVVYN